MARWLESAARYAGSATMAGALYRVADYPGFVPDGAGLVRGDLFALPDPDGTLARLDAYEECSNQFPLPHEYRRERRAALTPDGAIDAWVYVYALDVTGLERIASGDFLA